MDLDRLDADSKLIISFLVGGRDSGYALEFLDDVAKRLANRVQLTTDGQKVYLHAVGGAFQYEVDYALLVKIYGDAPKGHDKRTIHPRCNHDRACILARHRIRQCYRCQYQVSPTVGTIFENTRLPLSKWFAAIYLCSADKGGISAERLRKLIDVQWRTAQLMLDKIRRAMGDRDRQYVLGIRHHDQVELDDAFVGGRGRGGKRGRGAKNKRPVLVAVKHRANDRAGFIAMQAVDQVDSKTVSHFRDRLGDELLLRTDGWRAYGILALEHGLQVDSRPTPPEQVDKWLPIVHMAIANLKRFLLGTFHGVSSRKLQKYLDEFVYRYNRRFWESQLPERLLNICALHLPTPAKILYTEEQLS